MPYYEIHLDRETSEDAGAGGMFQVISINDDEGDEVTENFVDVGTHYPSLAAVRKIIAAKLGVPVDDVELSEI